MRTILLICIVLSVKCVLSQTSKEQQYLDSINKSPNNLRAYIWHLELAVIYYNSDNYTKALEYILKSIELKKENIGNYYDYANILKNSGNKDGKLIAFQLFAKNIPCAEAYNNIAFEYFDKGDYKKAKDNFLIAIKYDPKDYKCINNIGICYIKFPDCDSAYYYSKNALKLQNDYVSAADNIMDALNCQLEKLKNKGDVKAFCNLYSSIKAEYPPNFNNSRLNIIGGIKYSYYKYYDGVKDLAENPTYEGYLNLYDYMFSEEDYTGAIVALESALKLNPKGGEAFFNLGYIYMDRIKDFKKALNNFKVAEGNLSGLKKENCQYNIGICYDNLGDNTNAISTYKKVLTTNPTDKRTHYHLYMIYEKLGDKTNAQYHKLRS